MIRTGLSVPVVSLTPEEAPDCFGWIPPLVALDLAASGASTRREFGSTPAGPDLLTDPREMDDGLV